MAFVAFGTVICVSQLRPFSYVGYCAVRMMPFLLVNGRSQADKAGTMALIINLRIKFYCFDFSFLFFKYWNKKNTYHLLVCNRIPASSSRMFCSCNWAKRAANSWSCNSDSPDSQALRGLRWPTCNRLWSSHTCQTTFDLTRHRIDF